MTREEKKSRIEFLWAQEADIMIESARVVNTIQVKTEEAVISIRAEREPLERELWDGMTRIEAMEHTKVDPMTGKGTADMIKEATERLREVEAHIAGTCDKATCPGCKHS